jgi:hypothetical protein
MSITSYANKFVDGSAAPAKDEIVREDYLLCARRMCITADGKKFSSGERSKNRKPWTVSSCIMWASDQISQGVNWD